MEDDVNAADRDGCTPLMRAAEAGNAAVLPGLLARGARLEARDKWAQTALIYAANSGGVECIRALLQAGADLQAADDEGLTPLHRAAPVAGCGRGHRQCSRQRRHPAVYRRVPRRAVPEERGMHPRAAGTGRESQ